MMEDEKEYFESAADASDKSEEVVINDDILLEDFTTGDIEVQDETETESLTLTIEDYKITENAMIGVGLGGSALIVSMLVLGLITIFRRM